MKHRVLRALVIVGVVSVLSACGSAVKLDDASKAPVEDKGANGNGVAQIDVSQQNGDALNDPKGVLAKRSIYFDLDSNNVKEEYRSLVEAHATYLVAHRDRKISIEGNTDERGGSEYNLALGQRRSESVRRMMALLGVKEDQMEAVSFGKEKPKAESHDETSWAENRRADISYR